MSELIGGTKAKLWVRGGPFDGCGFSLLLGVTTVGRDGSNDIVVEHPAVSRRHARILANARGYWLEDLGSRNGTFVNGKNIGREPWRLKDAEEFQFGGPTTETTWVFREAQEEASAPAGGQQTMAVSLDELQRAGAATASGRERQAQAGPVASPCEAFRLNPNGSWTCTAFVSLSIPPVQIEVSRGTSFIRDRKFLGVDVAAWLDANCG